MANLTLKVDDDLLRRARIRAVELGTSVNAVVTEHLERFAGEPSAQRRAVSALLAQASELTDDDRERARQRGRRSWTRDDLYDDPRTRSARERG